MQNCRLTPWLVLACWVGTGACSAEPPTGSGSAGVTGSGDALGSNAVSSSASGGANASASAEAISTQGSGMTTSSGSSAGGGVMTSMGTTSQSTGGSSRGTLTGSTGDSGSGGATTAGGEGAGAMSGSAGTGGVTAGPGLAKPPLEQPGEPIFFGTTLDPVVVMTDARGRAESLANPESPQWRATGDQHRTYHFDETNRDEPYRLYVPTDWDGQSKLPLVMFLHGAGSNENTYVDQDNRQMLGLAQQHGFLLVSVMGADGAYGNFLRLSAPFGNQQGAAELMAQVTAESELTNELSEKDVINVLELILEEYPIDLTAMFLTGHSMGSGGTWYIGGKYSVYFRAIAPMSGPFVQETGYPWDNLRDISILVTEGTQTPSLEGSQLLGNWLEANGFDAEYIEVDADHGGMVPLVLPDVFEFFERARSN